MAKPNYRLARRAVEESKKKKKEEKRKRKEQRKNSPGSDEMDLEQAETQDPPEPDPEA